MSLAFCDSKFLSEAVSIWSETTLVRSKMNGITRTRISSHEISTTYFLFVISLPIFVKPFCFVSKMSPS